MTDEKPIGWLALNADRTDAVVVGNWSSKARKLYRSRGHAANAGYPVPVYLSDLLEREAELNG